MKFKIPIIISNLGLLPCFMATALLGILAVFAWKANVDPKIAYLPSRGSAHWIIFSLPVETRTHPVVNVTGHFRRSFTLETLPPSATLSLRAFRQFELSINGQKTLLQLSGNSWKEESRIDIAKMLHVGGNSIEVRVLNNCGPPALWLTLTLPGTTINSDTDWETSLAGSAWKRADLATKPKSGQRLDPTLRMMVPAAGLIARWKTLLSFAIFSGIAVAICFWIANRQKKRYPLATSSPWPLRIIMIIVALLWTVLFLNNALRLHLSTGFDATAHLEYVRYILEKYSVPLADQGWEMYQPPLYYAVAAEVLVASNMSITDPSAALAFRLLGLVLGLINLVLIGASLRLVFPVHPRRQIIGLIVAAFLPANLYLYQFPTNEVLLITLSSAVLLVMLRDVHEKEPSLLNHCFLGILLGLALLAKVSALLLVPVIFGVMFLRVMRLSSKRRWRGFLGIGIAASTAILFCGWHYGRIWLHFGSPLVGNWDARSGFLWWQEPGYHTLLDYLRFGRVLTSPLFAGFYGIWDGLYSTLWGDGLVSGVSSLNSFAPAWSYDLMSSGYLIALFPTAAMAFGAVSTVVVWFRRQNLVDTLLLGLVSVTLLAILYMTLLIPSYAQSKAFYLLSGGLLPLSAFAATGLDLTIGRRHWLAGILLTVLGIWALTAYFTFWIHG